MKSNRMKINQNEINERRPIWKALSEFYLDTELDNIDFKRIAIIFKESKYSLEEIRKIDTYEVFPILQLNLLSIIGEWVEFDENWLTQKIINRIQKRTQFNKLLIRLFYFQFRWMTKEYWQKLTDEYKKLI